MHEFNAGCMIFKAVHPVCAPFSLLFSVYLSLCAHDSHSGCTQYPTSAPGKCTHLNLNFEHWKSLRGSTQASSLGVFWPSYCLLRVSYIPPMRAIIMKKYPNKRVRFFHAILIFIWTSFVSNIGLIMVTAQLYSG